MTFSFHRQHEELPRRRAGGLAFSVATVAIAFTAPLAAAAPVGKPSKGASAATRQYLAQQKAVERTARFERKGSSVSATGWVSVVEDVKSREDQFLLHTKGGRTVWLKVPDSAKLKFTGEASQDRELAEGHVVQFDGNGTGTITASSITVAARLDQPLLRAIETSTDRPVQNRSVLVIPVKFGSGDPEPITPAALADEFFSTAATKRSVANFYDRSSRGRLSITGAVSPWVTITADPALCDYPAWATEAEDLLRPQGIEPDDYDQIQLVPRYDADISGECESFKGVSWGPRHNLTWADKPTSPSFPTGTAAHEIGHSLGLGHSHSMTCFDNGRLVPLDEECGDTPNYGDVDVMGGAVAFRPLMAFQRARLGLLPGDRIQDISADGATYTLTRESTSGVGSGKQLLRVRRNTGQPETHEAYFYLEYRAPLPPFDRYLPNDPALAGVTVHLASDHRGDEVNRYETPADRGDENPWLVPATSGDFGRGNVKQFRPLQDGVPENGDTALRAGDNLYDPVEDVTISVLSVSSFDAQVKVTPGRPAASGGTVGVVNGKLSVSGGSGTHRSRLSIYVAGSDIVVHDAGSALAAGTGCRQQHSNQVACARTTTPLFTSVQLGDGEDSLWVGKYVPGTISVDPGAGDDALDLDDSAVTVLASSTADGRDTFVSRGALTLNYGARTTPIAVSTSVEDGPVSIGSEGDYLLNAPEDSGNAPRLRFKRASIIGGSAADTFAVAATNDLTLEGGPGADTFSATGALARVVSADGAADSAISCAAGATLVRDGTDPSGSGCGTPLTGPQVRFIAAPSGGTVLKLPVTPSFQFVGSTPGSTFRCKTNSGSSPAGGTWAACTSPHTPAITTDGTYTFVVQAMDGTTPGGVEEYRTFIRATASPTLANTATASLVPNFALAQIGGLGGAADCSFGGAWFGCTQSGQLKVAAKPTAQTLELRRVDPAGNPSSVTTSVSVPAYVLPPFATITGGPNSRTVQTSTSASIGFSANEAGSTFECRLDAGTWNVCVSPKAYTGLANGQHVFEVRAVKGGAAGPSVSRTFTVRATTSQLAFSTLSHGANIDISAGTKSWIRWRGASPTDIDRSVGQLRTSTWAPLGSFTPFAASGATYTWTNALGANPVGGTSTGNNSGAAASGANTGFRVTVPASSDETRTLKLYVAAQGIATQAQVRASWTGGSVTTTNLSTPASDSTVTRHIVSLTYRPSQPLDTLTVDLMQTGGSAVSTNNVRLYAASIS